MESLSKQGDNTLVLDISIESKLVGISFIENDQNWPIYVKDVKILFFSGPHVSRQIHLFIYLCRSYVSEI